MVIRGLLTLVGKCNPCCNQKENNYRAHIKVNERGNIYSVQKIGGWGDCTIGKSACPVSVRA